MRFAVSAGANAFVFFQTAGLADHLLTQGKAFGAFFRIIRQTEDVCGAHAQCCARLGGQATADNQRNTAAGLNFVQDNL